MNHPLPLRWANSALLIGLCSLLFFVPVVHGEAGLEDRASFKSERNFKPRRHGAEPHRLFKLLHKLDVSDEQRRAIGDIIDKHRPSMRQFFEDMHTRRSVLQTILTSGEYDEKNLQKLASEQAASAEKMFLGTASTFHQISAILNTEQRAQLAVMIDKRGEHRRDMRRERTERRRSRDYGHATSEQSAQPDSPPLN